MFGIGPLEIMIIVIVIALIFGPGAVVLWILTRARGVVAPPAAAAQDPALEIARERYARGEIDAAQLAEIARTLGHEAAEPGTGSDAADADGETTASYDA